MSKPSLRSLVGIADTVHKFQCLSDSLGCLSVQSGAMYGRNKVTMALSTGPEFVDALTEFADYSASCRKCTSCLMSIFFDLRLVYVTNFRNS